MLVIIRAGIPGFNTAYHIQSRAPLVISYAILVARERIGGNWDLHRYPSIRPDSDVYTFGFSWNLWTKESLLAAVRNPRLHARVKKPSLESIKTSDFAIN